MRTAALVVARLKELGLEMKAGVTKHGVVALLKGGSDRPCAAVRADMDALPIKELRSAPYRSQNPGVSERYANYQAILRFTRTGHAKILEEGFIQEGAPVADRDIVFGGGGEVALVALVGEVRLK